MSKKKHEGKIITERFDPALWSIATVLSAATVYLACLI
jgi:CRP/FNR family transcriptional regulator, nitrogen fixation regulation protein